MNEIISPRELLKVEINDNENDWVLFNSNEWVDVKLSEDSRIRSVESPNEYYSTNQTLLRNIVAAKLNSAGKAIKQSNPDWKLQLLEGYRPLEKQQQMFDEQMSRLDYINDYDERIFEAHKFVAIPEVAGHPTGGAVDVQVIYELTGEPLDLGTKYLDFNEKTATKSRFLTQKQIGRRAILSSIMAQEGFYDYPGEWWHFSFGDREATYAKFGTKRKALYGQKVLGAIRIINNNDIL